MMITMHSILSSRYRRRALIGDIFFLITAIVLNILVFFDLKKVPIIVLPENKLQFIINISALIIFLLSIIFMFVEWQKKAARHEQAINQLSRLINELRSILAIEDETAFNTKAAFFNELYVQICETIPKIPDSQFNRLKARHLQKVELSKFIEQKAGKPYLIIWILFIFSKTFKNATK